MYADVTEKLHEVVKYVKSVKECKENTINLKYQFIAYNV